MNYQVKDVRSVTENAEPTRLPAGIEASMEVTLQRCAAGMQPDDMVKLKEMADMLFRAGVVRGRNVNIHDAMARILGGQELGITAFQAVQHLVVIYGGVSISASLAKALLLKRGYKFRWVMDPRKNHEWRGRPLQELKTVNPYAELSIQPPGEEPQTFVFDLHSAEGLGLLRPPREGKQASGWLVQPLNMLARAAERAGTRDIAPHVLLNMGVEEEIMTPEPAPAAEVTESAPADAIAELIESKLKPPPPAPPPEDKADEGARQKAHTKKADQVRQAGALISLLNDCGIEVPRFSGSPDPQDWTAAQLKPRIQEFKSLVSGYADKLSADLKDLTGETVNLEAKTVKEYREGIEVLQAKIQDAKGDNGSPI